MKQAAVVVAASLAGGIGIGVGQGLMGGPQMPVAWAQASIPTAGEEQTVIRVVRDVRPGVVRVKRQGGAGTGFVIRKDGVILTNAHVVGDAKKVEIGLASGKTLDGQVIGVDPTVDVAVVKVSGESLPEVPMADSDKLVVGQTAIAIGNPMGLDGTVTTGVVSATERQRSLDDFVGFIQTDAAINPGNSGGPLLDSYGRVIGMNTWIISRATGLGFAVPINVARDVAEQVMAKGKVSRAVLGVVPTSITEEVANRLQLPVKQGVVVTDVSADSSAAKAGIKQGDIFTHLDGQVLKGAGELRKTLRERKAGDKVTLTVRRGSETVTVPVVLTEAVNQ